MIKADESLDSHSPFINKQDPCNFEGSNIKFSLTTSYNMLRVDDQKRGQRGRFQAAPKGEEL